MRFHLALICFVVCFFAATEAKKAPPPPTVESEALRITQLIAFLEDRIADPITSLAFADVGIMESLAAALNTTTLPYLLNGTVSPQRNWFLVNNYLKTYYDAWAYFFGTDLIRDLMTFAGLNGLNPVMWLGVFFPFGETES